VIAKRKCHHSSSVFSGGKELLDNHVLRMHKGEKLSRKSKNNRGEKLEIVLILRGRGDKTATARFCGGGGGGGVQKNTLMS